jgi:hypothetical protein
VGVDALAPSSDHRAQRVQESVACVPSLQLSQRADRGTKVACPRRPSSLQTLGGPCQRGERHAAGPERRQRLGTRERGQAKRPADLAAQAAARDQHEPLAALGELVEELHRDAAAERVADDRCAVHADRCQDVAYPARVGSQRVVALSGRRVAVAQQVRCDHRVVRRESPGDLPPVTGGVEHSVDQHHRRASP